MAKPSLTERAGKHLPAAVGFGVPFFLIVYLAMEAGGYDLVVRSQLGIIVWWVVLLGALVGLLPVTRVTRSGWMIIGVMGVIALWTALGALTWTESTERSVIELGRVATLGGYLALLILVQGREGLRRGLCAVAAATSFISIVALASRFQPDLVGSVTLPDNYPLSRLNHPLEYWNGLAALMAMGLAPVLWVATSGRTIWGRAAAAAAIPLLVLTIYLTASRGGAIEAAVALVFLVVVFPKRLNLILAMVPAALGSVTLLLLIDQRPELRDRVLGETATSQGNEMTLIAIAICLVVAAIQGSMAVAERRGRLRVPEVSRAVAKRTGIAATVIAGLVVLVAFGSGFVGDRWSEIKSPAVRDPTVGRLASLNSEERYLGWKSALDASAEKSLTGIGPGTYEFWWARDAEGSAYFRDAHSIYLEFLAELGPVGLLAVLALILGPIVYGCRLALVRGSDERRSLLAAATAGMVAFAVASGIDWAWELTVLPLMFFALVAGVVGPSAESRRGRKHSRFRSRPFDWKVKAGFGVVGVLAVVAIGIPLAGTSLVRSSQTLAREGNLSEALAKADDAVRVQPYSATAEVQRALVLNELGSESEAIRAARRAVDSEPTNWKNWYVLGEVSPAGDARSAAWRKAFSLNPKSLFLSGLVGPDVEGEPVESSGP